MDLNQRTSAALLNCGDCPGFREKLLLKPRVDRPKIENVPRSSVLERLHCFLPQMAAANQKLQSEMEAGPAEQFDIENVEDAATVISMDVALVELDKSDSSSEEEEEEGEEGEEEDQDQDRDRDQDQHRSREPHSEDESVTVKTLKLPGQNKRKAAIQVLKESAQ